VNMAKEGYRRPLTLCLHVGPVQGDLPLPYMEDVLPGGNLGGDVRLLIVDGHHRCYGIRCLSGKQCKYCFGTCADTVL